MWLTEKYPYIWEFCNGYLVISEYQCISVWNMKALWSTTHSGEEITGKIYWPNIDLIFHVQRLGVNAHVCSRYELSTV